MRINRKILRYGLIGFSSFIVLILILFPSIAKRYIVNNSKELIGRQVFMDKLSINYFNGKLSIYDFKMFEPNERDVFLSFDTLIVNTAPYKYLSNIRALDQFYLEGLSINISKRDSVFNFDDLVAFHTAEDSTKSTSKEGETFRYVLNNLELKRANLSFYDADVDQTTGIDDFSFFVPQIYWDQENHSDANLKFNIADEGRIESFFNMYPKTGGFDGKITVTGLQLRSFYKYMAQYSNITAIDGALGSTINISGNINALKDILISTEAVLENFEMKDMNGETFLASKKISCAIPEINLDKNSILVRSVIIDQPYINFELDSVSNNYSRIFNVQSESSTTAKDTLGPIATESKYPDYFINSVKVTNGIMDYSDNFTGKPFNYHFSAIKINSDSIGSHKEWIDIKSDMLLNNRGNLKAEIGFNPMDPLNAEIDIAVENFLLSDLDIYSNYYTGHSVLVGDMAYFSSSKLTNGIMKSDNRLLIQNVDVKNNKGGLYAIPLKLAIWILKDKNGDIELDVPVTGAINDPQVDTWSLVWTTLKKRIFNATDNPVRPLARYIGAKPEDIESIAFRYPDTLITDEQSRQLDLILELEKKKEGVSIEMNLLTDPKILRNLLAEKNIERPGLPVSEPAKTDQSPDEALNKKVLLDNLSTDISRNITDSDQLDSLAIDYTNAIINNVKKYVLDKNPQTNIIVQKAKISNPDNIDSHPHIKVRYSMSDEEETSVAQKNQERQ